MLTKIKTDEYYINDSFKSKIVIPCFSKLNDENLFRSFLFIGCIHTHDYTQLIDSKIKMVSYLRLMEHSFGWKV